MADAPAPAPLRRIGDIELLREVGRGGMGVVYEGRQEKRRVAVKVLLGDDSDPEAVVRFQREASAASILQHPNIVPVTQFGRHEGVYYYVMPFVDGESLAARVRRQGALDPREAARFALQAALALDHAHRFGIVHRDIKPANLMLGERLMVTDFGLAKALAAPTLTAAGTVVGTPAYMSPEQAAGLKVGSRTDIYSLGATLYEMATGRVPFQERDVALLLRRIEETDPPLPSTIRAVPRDLETILLRAMQKDASLRYPTAAEMAEDLGRFLAGQSIRARRTGSVRKLARWVGRSRALPAAVVLLSALVVAGVFALRSKREVAKVRTEGREKEDAARRAQAERAFAAAEVLFGEKKWDEARKLYEEVVALGTPLAFEAKAALAELALAAGRLDDARRWIETLGRPPLLAAKLALREGEWRRAIELAKSVPDEPDAWDVLIEAHTALKDLDAARAALKEKVERQRARAQLLLREADAVVESEPGRAERLYRRALALCDAVGMEAPAAAGRCGRLLFARGLGREALPYLDRDPAQSYWSVRVRVDLGLWHDAHARFRPRDLDRESAETGLQIGLAMLDPTLVRACLPHVADPRLRSLATGESEDPVLRALVSSRAGDWERALPHATDPTVRGTLLFRLERTVEAAREFEKSRDPLGRIACAYELRGARAARELAEGAPGGDAVRVARVLLLLLEDRTKEALEVLMALFEEQPPIPAVALLVFRLQDVILRMPKEPLDRLTRKFENIFLRRFLSGDRREFERILWPQLNLGFRMLVPMMRDLAPYRMWQADQDWYVGNSPSETSILALLEDAAGGAPQIRELAEQRLRALDPAAILVLEQIAVRKGHPRAEAARRWAEVLAERRRQEQRMRLGSFVRLYSYHKVVTSLFGDELSLKDCLLKLTLFREAAGDLKAPEATAVLETYARDENLSVAITALQGLYAVDRAAFLRHLGSRAGLLAAALVDTVSLREPLESALKTAPEELRPLAVVLLASIGTRAETSSAWSRALADALLGGTAPSASDPDPVVRAMCALVFGMRDDPGPLMTLLDDPDPRVVEAALLALLREDPADPLETVPCPSTWAYFLLAAKAEKKPPAIARLPASEHGRIEAALRTIAGKTRAATSHRLVLGLMTRVPIGVDLLRGVLLRSFPSSGAIREGFDRQAALQPRAELESLLRELVQTAPREVRPRYFEVASQKSLLTADDLLGQMESDLPKIRLATRDLLVPLPDARAAALLDHEDLHVRRNAACLFVLWHLARTPGFGSLFAPATSPRRCQTLAWALARFALAPFHKRRETPALWGGEMINVEMINWEEFAPFRVSGKLRVKSPEDAIKLLRLAVDLDPSDSSLRYHLGSMLASRRSHAEAIEALLAAVEKLPPEYEQMRAEACEKLGEEYLASKDPENAILWLERSMASLPERPGPLARLGEALILRGEYATAEAKLTRALDLDPRSGEAYLMRGRARKKLGRLDEAAVDLSNALAYGGKPTEEDKSGLDFDRALLPSLLERMRWARTDDERLKLVGHLRPLIEGVPSSVREWLSSSNSLHRRNAVAVIAAVSDSRREEADWDALAAAAGDPDRRVRLAALSALRDAEARPSERGRSDLLAAARSAFRSGDEGLRDAALPVLAACPLAEVWGELLDYIDLPLPVMGRATQLANRMRALARFLKEAKRLPAGAAERLRASAAVETWVVRFAAGERGARFVESLVAALVDADPARREYADVLGAEWDPGFEQVAETWMDRSDPHAGIYLAGYAPELWKRAVDRLAELAVLIDHAIEALFHRRVSEGESCWRGLSEPLLAVLCRLLPARTEAACEVVRHYAARAAGPSLRTIVGDGRAAVRDRLDAAATLAEIGEDGGAEFVVEALRGRLAGAREYADLKHAIWLICLRAAGKSGRKEFVPVLRECAEKFEDNHLRKEAAAALRQLQ
ncbi:MAG: protein kinase [Planctomycetes bacterium]|nr:protein kinase [Planctomycetota bacterium]